MNPRKNNPFWEGILGGATSFIIFGLVTAGLVYHHRVDIFSIFASDYAHQLNLSGESQVGENPLAEESRIVNVVKESSPAVVSVVVSKEVPVFETYYEDYSPFGNDFFRDFFGGDDFGFQIPRYREEGTEKRQVGGGTGFLVSSDGLIVTNRHVVVDEDAEYSVLANDGNTHNAEVLDRDSFLDIAILKIEGDGFDYLEFGDSENLSPGQTVIAIGNALAEFQNSVSVGVVSGLSRSIVAGDMFGQSELLEGVIQTDAAINPGNSGGPLLDLSGNVIGVNVAVQRGAENIGFALPGIAVGKIVDSVKEFGEIVRPFLGVRYVLVNEAIVENEDLEIDYGALVVRGETEEDLAVVPRSPADDVGVVEGDIILEIDGTKIEKGNSLASVVREKGIGDKVALKVWRDGKTLDLLVTLDKAPEKF